MICDRLGGKVVEATSHDSGFTPGFASTLTLESGDAAFLKTAHTRAQPVAARSYSQEATAMDTLRTVHNLPAPTLLWADEGDWITLAYESCSGSPPDRPFTDATFTACLDLAESISSLPSPEDLLSLAADAPEFASCWDRVSPSALAPGFDTRLAEVSELARALPDLPANSLSHGDFRDDNVLLGSRTLACDWTNPCLAPPWLDVVTLAVAGFGDGLDVARHLAGRVTLASAPDDDVDVWLAAFAGFMRLSSLLPHVRNSPYLRTHAEWYATAAWSWLSERRGWETPVVSSASSKTDTCSH